MDQEKTYKWIQDRLRELNAGTIAAADFHQLETMAKEDPFIADALEGYKSHAHLNHTEYLDSLTRKIKSHKRERRRWLIPNLTVTAVAACLILIVGFYAVMSRLYQKEEPALANATDERELAIHKSGDTMAIYPAKEDEAATTETRQPLVSSEETGKKMDQPVLSRSFKTKENKSPASGTDAAAIASASQADRIGEVSSQEVLHPSGPEAVPGKSMELPIVPEGVKDESGGPYYANALDPAVIARRVTGKVTSINGDPLNGVNLLIPGTNLGVTSQADGQFELFLPNGETPVDVVYAGYEDTTIQIKPGDKDVVVQLKAISTGSQQDGLVAGSVSSEPRASKASPKMSTVTLQTDDHLLFADYLKSNSKFSIAENLDVPFKTTTLEFVINADGHPDQIKVLQTSGDKSLDAEAVRLIKKGPDWECGEAKFPCKVRYSIYFKG